jgi:hypothetical protein
MRKFLLLTLVVNLFVQLSLAITPEALGDKYTLMLKVTDKHNNIRVALIPGKYLLGVEPLEIFTHYFTYNVQNWQEVCQMWSDFKSPEDVGCFNIYPTAVNKKAGYFSCKLPLEQSDVSCVLALDPMLRFEEAVLVCNDFIEECSLPKNGTMNISNSPFNLDTFDIEFDENELQEYSKSNPPSELVVYARQIGVALYVRSMQVVDFVGTTWTELKRYLFS